MAAQPRGGHAFSMDLDVNEEHERIFGFSRDEEIGRAQARPSESMKCWTRTRTCHLRAAEAWRLNEVIKRGKTAVEACSLEKR